MVIVPSHLRQGLHGRDQGPRHLAAGRVVCVNHPRTRVAPFAPQRQHPGPRLVELRTNRPQLVDHLRPFGHHPFDDRVVAQTRSRRDRVLRVASH